MWQLKGFVESRLRPPRVRLFLEGRIVPTGSELLAAIADLLREEVTPVLDKADPRLGFQMRVAANSLAILEREARLVPRRTRASTSGW